MDQARAKWNDDRIDHLSGQVDSVRTQVDSLRHHMDNRFDRLQNAMIVTLASILAAFGGAIVAIRF
jgi:hypothetical protein